MSPSIDSKNLFTILITQLSSSAWTQLGKTPNPITGKPEKHLEAAAMTIGILESLLFKTAGNLTKAEDTLLSESVRDLKLTLQAETNPR